MMVTVVLVEWVKIGIVSTIKSTLISNIITDEVLKNIEKSY